MFFSFNRLAGGFRALCTVFVLALIIAALAQVSLAVSGDETVDDGKNYVKRVPIGLNNYHAHSFSMMDGDVLDFHISVVNGSAVDVLVFIERDFRIYQNAKPGQFLYAEKKLLDTTNISRSYKETVQSAPLNIFLVVDNTNVTEGAAPVGNVLVDIEAHLTHDPGDEVLVFPPGFAIIAVGAAAAVTLLRKRI